MESDYVLATPEKSQPNTISNKSDEESTPSPAKR
jgi:hypothetical protein